MKSGSWSSFQSALPFEARIGGEPDDEPIGEAPPPSPKTCGTCKHWDANPLLEDPAPTHGECQRIAAAAEIPDRAKNRMAHLALCQDVENYYAYLLTQADFGCVLHEEQT